MIRAHPRGQRVQVQQRLGGVAGARPVLSSRVLPKGSPCPLRPLVSKVLLASLVSHLCWCLASGNARSRWRSVQLASYLVDRLWPSVDLPTAADVRAKYAWWKWCVQEWATGSRPRFTRPRMIYAELLLQNLYRAAALPMQAVCRAVALLPPDSGLKTAAAASPALVKRLQSLDGYRSVTAMGTPGRLASVLTLACIMVGPCCLAPRPTGRRLCRRLRCYRASVLAYRRWRGQEKTPRFMATALCLVPEG